MGFSPDGDCSCLRANYVAGPRKAIALRYVTAKTGQFAKLRRIYTSGRFG
jgi:hypothetical protein